MSKQGKHAFAKEHPDAQRDLVQRFKRERLNLLDTYLDAGFTQTLPSAAVYSDRKLLGLCGGVVLDRLIAGMYLGRAVDHEGEVLEILVRRGRDKRATVRLMRKLLRKRSFAPKKVATNKLGSYGAAVRHLGLSCPHAQGLRQNKQAENSRQVVRRRERKMQRFNHRPRRNAA